MAEISLEKQLEVGKIIIGKLVELKGTRKARAEKLYKRMDILKERWLKHYTLLKEKGVGLLLKKNYNRVYNITDKTEMRIGETAIELENLGYSWH